MKFYNLALAFLVCMPISLSAAEDEAPQNESFSFYLYEGGYDCLKNGLKGAAYAGMATPIIATLGGFCTKPPIYGQHIASFLTAGYFSLRAIDLLIKRGILTCSNKQQFGNDTRKHLAQKASVSNFVNRLAKAAVSAYLAHSIIRATTLFQKYGLASLKTILGTR